MVSKKCQSPKMYDEIKEINNRICQNCKYHYIEEISFDYPQSCCNKTNPNHTTEKCLNCDNFEYSDDYITNLQEELEEQKRIEQADFKLIQELEEENKILKIEKQEEYNRFNLMAKFRDKALERTFIYKSRNEKANEYIKEHTNNFVEYLDVYETKELSNILEGDKDD